MSDQAALLRALMVTLWSAQLVVCQQATSAAAPYRLPTDIVPSLYTLNIITDLDLFTFNGSEVIQLICRRDTSQITLHAKNLSVSSVTLKDASNTEVKVTSISAGDFDFFIIKVESPLLAGNVYYLHLEFQAILSAGLMGYYRSRYTDRTGQTKWMSVTQLSLDNARMAFPCWDEPLFRANFSIRLAHKSGLRAISNMPMLAQTPHESLEGFVWSQFQVTPPTATEVIAFLIGEFEFVRACGGSTLITIYTAPGKIEEAQLAISIAPRLLAYYENYFQRKYPLPKLDIVAVPDFFWLGMENWGLITCSEIELLYNNSMSTFQKYDLCTNVAHEIMHHWLGDLVEHDWWDGLWFKEGFAYYFQGLAMNQVFSDWNAGIREVISQTVYSFSNDASSSDAIAIQTVIDDPGDTSAVYNYAATRKASLLIYMIQSFLGDDIFQLGQIIFIKRFQYQSVNKTALYSAFQLASQGKCLLPEGVDIATILDTWVLQLGLPLVNCTRHGSTITVTQQRFYDLNETTGGNERWWVPVTLSTARKVNFDTRTSVWMDPSQEQLTVETEAQEGDWIIMNIKRGVYCVVNYDTFSWNLIINHLLTGDLSLVDEFNRHSLVTDIFHLARVGYVPYSQAFQLLRYAARERSYVAWLGTTDALLDMEPLLKRTDIFPQFKALAQYLLGATYDSLGFITEVPTQFQILRLKILIISWAVEYDVESCVNQALQVFQRWKSGQIDPNEVSVDFLWYIALVGVKHGGREDWDFVYQQLNQTKTELQVSNFLYALAWTQHEDLLERYLNLTLDPTSLIPQSKATEVFEDITGTTPLGFNTAFAFMENNAARIDQYTDLGSCIKAIYERSVFETDINRMKSFLSKQAGLVSSYQSDIDSGLKSAQMNLLWMSKYYKQVSAALTSS